MPIFLELLVKAKSFLVFVPILCILCLNTETTTQTYILVIHNLGMIAIFHNQIKGYFQRDYVRRFEATEGDPVAVRNMKKFPTILGTILGVAEALSAFFAFAFAYHLYQKGQEWPLMLFGPFVFYVVHRNFRSKILMIAALNLKFSIDHQLGRKKRDEMQ